MKTVNHLGTDPIGKLVPRIAFPSMLAQFVSVLYSIVDRMYIGHIASVGDLALAGVGVCGPILTMIGAFSSLIGVGGAPLLGIRLGEKNEKEASRILANAFLMLVSLSLVLTAAALFLTRPMLMAFGASTVTYPYARAYFMIYVSGSVFALLSTGLNQFVICQGFASEGMKSVLLGAVLNLLLDPVFIFVLHLGVRGAAIATVLSQIASCLYVLHILFEKTIPIRITFGGYSFAIMKRILTVGYSVSNHCHRQCDDHCDERRPAAVCTRRTGRQLHHLCNDRSELYADYYDAARRNQRRNAVNPRIQLWSWKFQAYS